MSEPSVITPWQPPSLRVVNPARDQLTFEQELEQARQRGYQEGLRNGLEDGRQQARAMLAEMAALWDAMQQPFADMEHEVHSQLLGLAVSIAEAVLQRELKTDRDHIAKALELALDALGNIEQVVDVELSPRDVDMVSSLLGEEHIDHRIKTNPNIMPGGCRLRHGHALVDNTVEALIAETIASITERSRVTDAQGNEAARALDPEEIAAIAERFARAPDKAPEVAKASSNAERTETVNSADAQTARTMPTAEETKGEDQDLGD